MIAGLIIGIAIVLLAWVVSRFIAGVVAHAQRVHERYDAEFDVPQEMRPAREMAEGGKSEHGGRAGNVAKQTNSQSNNSNDQLAGKLAGQRG